MAASCRPRGQWLLLVSGIFGNFHDIFLQSAKLGFVLEMRSRGVEDESGLAILV